MKTRITHLVAAAAALCALIAVVAPADVAELELGAQQLEEALQAERDRAVDDQHDKLLQQARGQR